MATKEYFPGIGKIKFEGVESKNPMAFRYYDANKIIMGKPMKEWLKFAMAWWHTLCAEGGDQFGGGTKTFPWNESACPIERAKAKMEIRTKYRLQKTRQMQALSSCRKSVLNTTASTM